MKLELRRYFANSVHTKGVLLMDGKLLCHTLEDPWHANKIPGETRIPAGTYQLGLRTIGGFHQRYSHKFEAKHRGMIQILDVPNYEYILIHIGNYPRSTEGCILVGQSAMSSAMIANSTAAYKMMYGPVANGIEQGKSTIEVRDV